MPRRKTGRRRGRPRKLHAKRRATTRIGRRTGHDPVDEGSPQLRHKKRQITTRLDLELTPVGFLFGHGYLDAAQYDRLGFVTQWLQRFARELGPKGTAVAGLWNAITGAVIGTAGANVPVAVGDGADHVRYVLGRMLRHLDGSRNLVIDIAEGRCPPLVIHLMEGKLTGADERDLERLRVGLDAIGGRRTT